MNRKTRAEERIEALDTSPEALAAAQVEAVRAERDEAVAKAQAERDEAVAKAQAERDDYLAALQRERAEFTNFRRRTADERHQERGLAGVDLITKVLALADDFDRAIETRPADLADSAWAEGIAAIDRKLRQLLETEGVTAVEAVPGTPFDPRQHEAIVSVPGTGRAEGEIVEEVRRGYRLRDRLIRPALVAVAAAPDPAPVPAPDPAPDHKADPAPDNKADPKPGLVN